MARKAPLFSLITGHKNLNTTIKGALLYMAAMSAIRVNKEIREFYQRLKERGKPGKVALVACMRKLALICWAHYKMAQASTP